MPGLAELLDGFFIRQGESKIVASFIDPMFPYSKWKLYFSIFGNKKQLP